MDFEDFTSTSQFNMEKINKFAKLDNIPGFCLLKSEKAYLEKFRSLLRAEYEADKEGAGIVIKEDVEIGEIPQDEPVLTEKKTTRKRTTTTKTEE